LKKDDILFSMAGIFLGKNAIVTEDILPANTNQALAIIRLNKNLALPKFIHYYLRQKNVVELVNNMSGQSAQPNINFEEIKSIEVLLPPLLEQTSIAETLSSLDDKINLLYRQNKTLEQLAETQFRQWFIEFSENKSEPYIETELGLIPQSLRICEIKELPHILETGKRPKGGVGFLTEGVPSIGAENIKGLGIYDYGKTKYVSREFAKSMNKGFIQGYELLIYKDGGTPGHFIPRYSIFGKGFPFEEMAINEHVFKLDFGIKSFNFFMYFFFQTPIINSILVSNGAKAAIPGINQEDIKGLCVFHPKNGLVKRFGELTMPCLEKILSNCRQIKTLKQLRDTLLPKLMSGEVSVNNCI
jgi:type I restriction enzyme, S subunit